MRTTIKNVDPSNYEYNEKFIRFMKKSDTASFGQWMFSNGYNLGITDSELNIPRWINVAEALPETDVCVLVLKCLTPSGDPVFSTGIYEHETKRWRLLCGESHYETDKVAAWRHIRDLVDFSTAMR